MKTVITKYYSYTQEAAAVAEKAYAFGNEMAKAAEAEGHNPYEISGIIVDAILNAFAITRIKHGVEVRIKERETK